MFKISKQKNINFILCSCKWDFFLVYCKKEVNNLSDYINESADIFNEDDKKKSPLFIRFLKWFCIGIIILIIGILIARIYIHRDSKITNKVIMTQAFLEEYEKNPDELEVRKYGIPEPWIDVILSKIDDTVSEEDDKKGRLIEFDSLYHIPKTKQLQVSVKYNEDIIPDGVKGFPLKLRLVDEKGSIYEQYIYETASVAYFRHVRVCFEDIEIETGEFDKDGISKRHSYTLEIDIKQPDGSYKNLCEYPLYNGNEQKTAIYAVVDYKV